MRFSPRAGDAKIFEKRKQIIARVAAALTKTSFRNIIHGRHRNISHVLIRIYDVNSTEARLGWPCRLRQLSTELPNKINAMQNENRRPTEAMILVFCYNNNILFSLFFCWTFLLQSF